MSEIFFRKKVLILTFFFSLIFIYYLSTPIESSKAYIIKLGTENILKERYLIWGLINDYIYKTFDTLIGNFISSIVLIELIIGFQLSALWSFTIYKIQDKLHYLSLFTFISPFVLNYFAMCTRDAIALSLFFLITYKSWSRIKFLISILISFIHIGILPLIMSSLFIYFNRERPKLFFIFITCFSILIAILAHFLLRYTDIVELLPIGKYREALFFPRILFIEEANISKIVGKAYNVYGNFNFKILSFGVLGQIFTIYFKNKFPNNTFPISFSVFFVCASLSSIPNADRYTYHPVLLSFPYLISFSIEYLKIILNKLNLKR